MSNPFTPSFGRVPAVMAGRESLIDDLAFALDNYPNDPGLSTILIGARGTGKTAMLAYMQSQADQRGWVSICSSSVPGMLQDAYEQAVRRASHLLEPERGRSVTGVSLAGLGGVQFADPEKQQANWRSRMSDVLDSLNERGIGLLIEIDEVDPNLPELVQLVTAYQHFVMEQRKVALLMAGLPHKVSTLLNGDPVSFLRRSQQRRLGPIADYEVEAALRDTALEGGKVFDGDALDAAVKAVDGFPYMLQLVGYRSWNAARQSEKIDAEASEKGIKLAKGDYVEGSLKATLRELSPGDLAFMQAMLPDVEVSTAADLVKRMGKGSSYVSAYKKRLLEQGVIEEAGRGKVRFALPLLREYLPEYLEHGI